MSNETEKPVVLDPDQTEGFVQEEQVETARQENEGIDVHIRSAKEKPLYYKDAKGDLRPVLWRVAGSHSDHYKRAEKTLRQRKLSKKSFTGEVIYEDSIEKAAACVLSWEGMFSRRSADGPLVEVPFTPHNVKQVLVRCPWVLEDVQHAMQDHASFFGNGSTPPATISDSLQG